MDVDVPRRAARLRRVSASAGTSTGVSPNSSVARRATSVVRDANGVASRNLPGSRRWLRRRRPDSRRLLLNCRAWPFGASAGADCAVAGDRTGTATTSGGEARRQPTAPRTTTKRALIPATRATRPTRNSKRLYGNRPLSYSPDAPRPSLFRDHARHVLRGHALRSTRDDWSRVRRLAACQDHATHRGGPRRDRRRRVSRFEVRRHALHQRRRQLPRGQHDEGARDDRAVSASRRGHA